MNRLRTKIIALALTVLVANGLSFTPVSYGVAASDYEYHWAKTAIEKALESGVLKGYSDGTIRPDYTMTRAEFFSMLNNAFKYTESKEINFIDVGQNLWYTPVLKKAVAAGYLDQVDSFARPNDMITREEVAIYLCSAKSLGTASLGSDLTDLGQASVNGKAAILSILETGIMKGTPEGKFLPKAKITRAQALTALMNAVAYDSPDLAFKKPTIFGSETVSQMIRGNVTIYSKDVKLQQLVINGDLILQSEIGNGTITLSDVTVKGTIYVYGSGTIAMNDVITEEINIQNTRDTVKIEITGETEIDDVVATTSIRLIENRAFLKKEGFITVKIDKSLATDVKVALITTKIATLQIDASNITVVTDGVTEISTLNIFGLNTKMKGVAQISRANVRASGSSFEMKPVMVDVYPGVKEPVYLTNTITTP